MLCTPRQDGLKPVALFGARIDLTIRPGVQVDHLRPSTMFEAKPGSLLKMPDTRDAQVCLKHFMHERHGLPIQECINDVRLEFPDTAAPIRARNILHVSE